MSKNFTFSKVNSLRDLNCAKQSILNFEKFIRNKGQSESTNSPLQDHNKTQTNFKRSSQSMLKRFALGTHRQTQSEKTINSILVKRNEQPSQLISSRPSSVSKKVSFKNLVQVVDTQVGIRKSEKLIETESKLRNSYFFNQNPIRTK